MCTEDYSIERYLRELRLRPTDANEVMMTRRLLKMKWNSPKIVEVPVGMEINMYACASRNSATKTG